MTGSTKLAEEGTDRRLFFGIVWVSAIVAWVAHVSEVGFAARAGLAAAILLGLAVWVHAVQRMQTWPAVGLAGTKLFVTLAGAYVGFAALLVTHSTYLFLLFGMYTLTFAFAAGTKPALIASAALTLVWLGGWIYHELPIGAIATPIFVWASLNVINHFMERISSQNEERRMLLEEIDATRSELAAAERRRGVLEERQRMAVEIHDTLAQGFTSIVLLSEATGTRLTSLPEDRVANSLELIQLTARENLASARHLVQALRPPELEAHSLTEAIQRLAQRHQEETGTPVHVASNGQEQPLGGSADIALLRTAQEALSNAKKHAQASNIKMELNFSPADASISVTDDGCGFSADSAPTAIAGGVGGQGLDGLKARVESEGGQMHIVTAPGQGTTIEAVIPMAAPGTP